MKTKLISIAVVLAIAALVTGCVEARIPGLGRVGVYPDDEVVRPSPTLYPQRIVRYGGPSLNCGCPIIQ